MECANRGLWDSQAWKESTSTNVQVGHIASRPETCGRLTTESSYGQTIDRNDRGFLCRQRREDFVTGRSRYRGHRGRGRVGRVPHASVLSVRVLTLPFSFSLRALSDPINPPLPFPAAPACRDTGAPAEPVRPPGDSAWLAPVPIFPMSSR